MVEALEFKGKCLSALVQMLGTRVVSERLYAAPDNLGETHGVREKDGVAIGAPFTHEVLAQMVGASRQWVTITLDRFQREGLIRIGKRKNGSAEEQAGGVGTNNARFVMSQPPRYRLLSSC